MTIKELLKAWEARLQNFQARPNIAKGKDERTAIGCQHGRTTTLKQCIKEIKTKIKEELTVNDKTETIKKHFEENRNETTRRRGTIKRPTKTQNQHQRATIPNHSNPNNYNSPRI